MKNTHLCAMLITCASCLVSTERTGEDSNALSTWAGAWHGHADYLGSPMCPYTEGCDHDVALYVGLSGASVTATYTYPQFEFSCTETYARDARMSPPRYTSVVSDCSELGRVWLGPLTSEGLAFRWERDFGAHDGDTFCLLTR